METLLLECLSVGIHSLPNKLQLTIKTARENIVKVIEPYVDDYFDDVENGRY